jgi:membrane protein
MTSLKDRVAAALARLRARFPWFDHTVRMVQHYGSVNGNGQAGSVTFFGFLSVFPVLALAFFAVGLVARVDPAIKGQMVDEIGTLLPGVVGPRPGQVPLGTIEDYAGTVGLIGLVAVAYSGLGWLSGLRQALEVMFVVPRKEQPNLLIGKLRDLGALLLIGLTLLVSVALSGAVTGFSGTILDAVGIDPEAVVPAVLLSVLGHVLAVAASTVLLMTMFTLLLVEAHTPRRALWRGALLGAVGFELLKLGANLLLAQTQGSPAFQAFGVALILLVWINYFSRLVMYAAAWAYTDPVARARRAAEAVRAPGAVVTGSTPLESPPDPVAAPAVAPWRPMVVGAGVALLGAAVVRGLRGE